MSVYARQIATAKRLIAEKGEACHWREPVLSSTPDPERPWIETPTAASGVEHPVSIAFFPVNRQNSALVRALGGTEVSVGNLYGIMPAVLFTVTRSGIVIRNDGSAFGVINADPLSPNGEIILWSLELSTV